MRIHMILPNRLPTHMGRGNTGEQHLQIIAWGYKLFDAFICTGASLLNQLFCDSATIGFSALCPGLFYRLAMVEMAGNNVRLCH